MCILSFALLFHIASICHCIYIVLLEIALYHGSSSCLPVYIFVQATGAIEAYQEFCNGNIALIRCTLAIGGITGDEAECANTAEDFAEGTLSRENASAIVCTSAACSGPVRTARNACNGVDDDVSYCSSTFCLTYMHDYSRIMLSLSY